MNRLGVYTAIILLTIPAASIKAGTQDTDFSYETGMDLMRKGKYSQARAYLVESAFKNSKPETYKQLAKYSETVHAALNRITSTLNSANRALNTESEYKALELLEPVLEKYKGMKPAKALIFRASSLSQRTGRKEKALELSKDIIDNYWNGQQDDSGIIPYCAAYIARKRKIT